MGIKQGREEIQAIDQQLAELYVKRMKAAAQIAEEKKKTGQPVFDAAQEKIVLERNLSVIEDELRAGYQRWMKALMTASKDYQRSLIGAEEGAVIEVATRTGCYEVFVQPGCLKRLPDLETFSGKSLLLTDDGVPEEYATWVAAACENCQVVRIAAGESSKTLYTAQRLLEILLQNQFTRSDRIIAVGGGMVCDLAGFVASVYMRGIESILVPTTLLAQVDASIGGKTAIDFGGIKNTVGSFYPPRKVWIDPETLATLTYRQYANGMAEVIKMAVCLDEELFSCLEAETPLPVYEVVRKAVLLKKRVVEADEMEVGERKVLNFGHTVGHALEACEGLQGKYHGECVALGMLPMCSAEVRERLVRLLKRYRLPMTVRCSEKALRAALLHDKKTNCDKIDTIWVEKIGTYERKERSVDEICRMANAVFGGGT